MFSPFFFIDILKASFQTFKNGSDHKIIKYSVILGGDRSCTIIFKNQDIYVVKCGIKLISPSIAKKGGDN
jgi:uncharacterized membrane protein